MATGRLQTPIQVGNVLNTNTLLYTVPNGYYAVFNVSLTNTTTSAVTFRLAIATTAASPGTAEYIEYDTTIVAKGVFERTGLVAGAGLNVVCVAGTNLALSATVYGIETSTT
jgi:hypothetical protein